MLKSEPAKINSWTGSLVWRGVHVLFGVLLAVSAHTATYYVDSSVSSSGNGQSWTTAWKSLSNITGVSAGDTVFISGGPSGTSQTYSVSNWSPPSGSASGSITYQIGQDSAHNGNAIFTGSGNFFSGAPNYVTFSGQVGNDTAQHFTLTGYSGILGGNTYFTVNNFRFAYVSATLTVTYNCFWFYGGSGIEIDHNYLNAVSGSGGNGGNDVFCQFSVMAGGTWDAGAKVHNNTVLIPRWSAGQNGYDFIQCNGSGISMYSNVLLSVVGTYNGGQHGDGVQALGGTSYLKVFNNVISNMPSSAVFFDCYGGNVTYSYVYNNTILLPGNNDFGIFGGPDSGGPTTGTLNNCVVANNLFVGSGAGSVTMEWAGPGQGVAFTPGLFYVCNNVFYNGGTWSYSFNSGGQQVIADNPTGVSSSDFVNASAGNFNLTSGATDLIGKGTNLSSFFTIDAAGNSRPGLPAAWDIGAYKYGTNSGGSSNSLPTVSAISVNASDINQSQAGLQIYGGTVVSFSATAANALTYQWSYTVNGGSAVVFQSGSGAVPAVNFNFGTNTIGNTYVWTISVSNTQGSAQSQLTLNVVSPPVPSSSLTFAAQSGSISSPFVLGTNGTTIYVYQPIQTVGINGNGIATYNFTITNAGNYEVQALVNAPNDAANSMYVNVDGVPQDPGMTWDVLTTSGFEERLVSWRGNGTDTANQFVPWIFPLTNGVHQILFYGREANIELAGFSILPAPPTPAPPVIITQ